MLMSLIILNQAAFNHTSSSRITYIQITGRMTLCRNQNVHDRGFKSKGVVGNSLKKVTVIILYTCLSWINIISILICVCFNNTCFLNIIHNLKSKLHYQPRGFSKILIIINQIAIHDTVADYVRICTHLQKETIKVILHLYSCVQ